MLRTFWPKSLGPDAFAYLFPISPRSVPTELSSLTSFHFLFCIYRCTQPSPVVPCFLVTPMHSSRPFPWLFLPWPRMCSPVLSPSPHLSVNLHATLPVNPPWLSLLERITPGPPPTSHPKKFSLSSSQGYLASWSCSFSVCKKGGIVVLTHRPGKVNAHKVLRTMTDTVTVPPHKAVRRIKSDHN